MAFFSLHAVCMTSFDWLSIIPQEWGFLVCLQTVIVEENGDGNSFFFLVFRPNFFDEKIKSTQLLALFLFRPLTVQSGQKNQ